MRSSFDKWASEGASGVGLLLGEPSGGLIDIDLDHPKALRLKDHFLPPSAMQSGRTGRRRSHRWYRVTDDLPTTRRYKMPDGQVSVELRSTGGQTVIPPSIHPSGESYQWEGSPWGGKDGPKEVSGRKLAIQVALLGLGSVLLDAWPKQGSRHEAYLALAGGLLRLGEGIHPYWEQNLPVIIEAMADATHDEDGAEARVKEVMGTTINRLRDGGKAVGFPKLAEIIGVDHAESARRMAKEVESLGGYVPGQYSPTETPPTHDLHDAVPNSTLDPEKRNPMEERISTWGAVDLEPYLTGEVVLPDPTVLQRVDGKGLLYPGMVNSLFGLSESAKSWVAMYGGVQEIAKGERVLYLDFEDSPAGIIDRFRRLGAGDDDLKNQLIYVHPDDPLADMQKYRFGASATDEGRANASVFRDLLKSYDPTLIIVDGMNEIYGLHGHDTNDATGTSIVTSWLKTLCRGGRSTVVVIDHTGKGGGSGSSPIGAHHKIAMVQGTAIRADVLKRPMVGELGRIRLVVYKDRPGSVRAFSSKDSEQIAGIAEIDSRREGITSIRIVEHDSNDLSYATTPAVAKKLETLSRMTELKEKIIDLFGGDVDKELTTGEVVDELGVEHAEVRDAWDSMLIDRTVKMRNASRARRSYGLNYQGADDDG